MSFFLILLLFCLLLSILFFHRASNCFFFDDIRCVFFLSRPLRFSNSLHDSLGNSARSLCFTLPVKNANGIHYLCVCRFIVNAEDDCMNRARSRPRAHHFSHMRLKHILSVCTHTPARLLLGMLFVVLMVSL